LRKSARGQKTIGRNSNSPRQPKDYYEISRCSTDFCFRASPALFRKQKDFFEIHPQVFGQDDKLEVNALWWFEYALNRKDLPYTRLLNAFWLSLIEGGI